jgi:serine protease Do
MNTRFHVAGIMLLFCVLSLTGCAMEPARNAVNMSPIAVPEGMTSKSLYLSKVVTKIPLGEQVLHIYYSWWRTSGASVEWRGGHLNLTDEEMIDSFRHELTQSKYFVLDDSKALFDAPSALRADLLVAGAIEKVETSIWFPFSSSPNASYGITSQVQGSTFMKVRWQVYSRADGKIVYEATTEGSFKSDDIITSTIAAFWKRAFSANVRNLIADPAFLAITKSDSPKEVTRPI